jgi:hypothetical protein
MNRVNDVLRDLRTLVAETGPRLGAIGEEQSLDRGPGKWSRREILGHLVDSALNNHQRVVRGQLAVELVFPGYQQDEWVAVQGFHDRPWKDTVSLWTVANHHLAEAIARVPDEQLDTPWTLASERPITLEFMIRDYPKHLRHHLQQIFEPEVAAGKHHDPHA